MVQISRAILAARISKMAGFIIMGVAHARVDLKTRDTIEASERKRLFTSTPPSMFPKYNAGYSCFVSATGISGWGNRETAITVSGSREALLVEVFDGAEDAFRSTGVGARRRCCTSDLP